MKSSESRTGAIAQVVVLLPVICINGGCQYPQHLLYIDTDAPVLSQLLDAPDVVPDDGRPSEDAVVDRLLVEVRDQNNRLVDACSLPVGDASNWPVSFGIARGSGPVRVRLRAFRQGRVRGLDTESSQARCSALGARAELPDISPEVTIDRLVDLPDLGLADGVVERRVTLSLDCLGAPVNFARGTTCVDGQQREVSAKVGQSADDPARASRIGTSRSALPRRCTIDPPPDVDAVCVRGGLTIMGDPDFIGYSLVAGERPSRWRAALLSPFWMDRREFSVRRLLALRQPGDPEPLPRTMAAPFCTWDPQDPMASADLPVACLRYQSHAQTLCQRAGGALPTEAQWEHAARGRGRGWRFPWGQDWPDCDRVIAGRVASGGNCPGSVPDWVEAPSGDRSLDGVWNLGGNVDELTLDHAAPYTDRCGLQAGLTLDPVCRLGPPGLYVSRGSDSGSGIGSVQAVRRTFWPEAPADAQTVLPLTSGFRCVYPGEKTP